MTIGLAGGFECTRKEAGLLRPQLRLFLVFLQFHVRIKLCIAIGISHDFI